MTEQHNNTYSADQTHVIIFIDMYSVQVHCLYKSQQMAGLMDKALAS